MKNQINKLFYAVISTLAGILGIKEYLDVNTTKGVFAIFLFCVGIGFIIVLSKFRHSKYIESDTKGDFWSNLFNGLIGTFLLIFYFEGTNVVNQVVMVFLFIVYKILQYKFGYFQRNNLSSTI